ncbi:hypothetical protein [Phaeobacter inhibens]|uniref:hypothetical protein n=1 Tax=Phaeobacter inhibens TaxID=221822 RepID=UPI0021A74507|nr:hypothetical protein [Phaeobacter inhibens]UWR87831.1 hypothetical protein K4L01_13830 [Phaeobacter inhibens]
MTEDFRTAAVSKTGFFRQSATARPSTGQENCLQAISTASAAGSDCTVLLCWMKSKYWPGIKYTQINMEISPYFTATLNCARKTLTRG